MKKSFILLVLLISMNVFGGITRYRSVAFTIKENGKEWSEQSNNSSIIVVDTDKKLITVHDEVDLNFYIVKSVEIDKKANPNTYSFICVDDYDIKTNVVVFLENDKYNGLFIEYGNISYLYIFDSKAL